MESTRRTKGTKQNIFIVQWARHFDGIVPFEWEIRYPSDSYCLGGNLFQFLLLFTRSVALHLNTAEKTFKKNRKRISCKIMKILLKMNLPPFPLAVGKIYLHNVRLNTTYYGAVRNKIRYTVQYNRKVVSWIIEQSGCETKFHCWGVNALKQRYSFSLVYSALFGYAWYLIAMFPLYT